MKRLFVAVAAATVLMAQAQVFPGSKPIAIVVPFAAGGPTDLVARQLAETMRKTMGQGANFVVENTAGAGGTIGAGVLAKAPADGYTVMVATTAPLYSAPFLFSKLPYDVHRDFAFVSRLTDGGLVFVVNKDVIVFQLSVGFIKVMYTLKITVVVGTRTNY